MTTEEETLVAARLDRLNRWIERWQEIKYFGRAIGALGQWVIRVCVAVLLVIEVAKRLLER